MEKLLAERVVEHVQKIATVEERLEHIDEKVQVVDVRVSNLTEQVKDVKEEVRAVSATINKIVIKSGAFAAGFIFAFTSVYKAAEFFFRYIADKIGQGVP